MISCVEIETECGVYSLVDIMVRVYMADGWATMENNFADNSF